MSFLEWDTSLDIKVDEMNHEHKKLIDLMNKVHDCVEAKESIGAIKATLNSLINYTRKHFSDEEKFLRSINYPSYDTHKKLHTDLLAGLDQFAHAYNVTGEIPDGFFKFLKNWLFSHIRISDVSYGKYAASNALKMAS